MLTYEPFQIEGVGVDKDVLAEFLEFYSKSHDRLQAAEPEDFEILEDVMENSGSATALRKDFSSEYSAKS